MAAPTIRSSSTASSTSAGYSISKPTGTASGDVLLLIMSGVNNVNFEQPSGFTQIGSTLLNGNCRLLAAYKIAGGSEPASYTPTVSDGTSADAFISNSAILICIQNTNNSPIDVTATAQNTTTVPSVTTSGIDRLVISAVNTSDLLPSTATVPSTWTSIANIAPTPFDEETPRTQAAYKTYASAGAIGTNNWSSSRKNLMTIAVSPVAAAATYNSNFFMQGN